MDRSPADLNDHWGTHTHSLPNAQSSTIPLRCSVGCSCLCSSDTLPAPVLRLFPLREDRSSKGFPEGFEKDSHRWGCFLKSFFPAAVPANGGCALSEGGMEKAFVTAGG